MADIKKWQDEFRAYIDGLNIPRDDYRGIMEYIDEVPAVKPEPSAQTERKVFEEMSDTEFEKWLHEHGICNPDIHELIPCDVVPSLIDFAINELPPTEPRWIPVTERPPRGGTGMIICGFPGTGKSMMAKFSRWVDLESTPFEKNWLLYSKVAKHMSDNGYTVMVSTHAEMLEALEQIEARYTVVIPPMTDKDTYLHRYDMRGNTYDFIQLLDKNWYRWITAIVEKPTVLKTVVILPKDGCIQAWAERMRGEQE